MKKCRHCDVEFVPTERQLLKYDYECPKCHSESRKRYSRSYYKRNREKIIQKNRASPEALMLKAARRRLGKVMKSACGIAKHGGVFGCSSKELLEHIESLFQNGMNWENYGEWHVDHIIPCRAFKGKEDWVNHAFNYKNLQPLWAKDNLSKSDRMSNGISARKSLTGL